MNYQSRIIRCTSKRPCPVCGRKDWCSFTEDGALAFCMKVSSGSFKTARNGAHLHRLIESDVFVPRPRPLLPPAPKIEAPRASIEQRHLVYTTLLREHLVLASEHRTDLLSRGLDDAAIARAGYVSTPSRVYAGAIARALDFSGLDGVPGFYRDGDEPRMVWTAPGYFLPVRDHQSRIQALLYRRFDFQKGDEFGKYIWLSSGPDKNDKPRPGGASSGAPPHVAKPHLLKDTSEVLLTEGALKADVIAHLLNAPVIGAAPTCFSESFAPTLREAFPNILTCQIAFDADFKRKIEVRTALERLMRLLCSAGFTVRVKLWPERMGKGYDDYLLASARESEAA